MERPPKPRTQKITERKAIINDAVRRDGGKSTEDVPVSTEQIDKIERAAIDHTADEPGS